MSDETKPATQSHHRNYPIPGNLNLLIAAMQVCSAVTVFYLTAIADQWWQILLLALFFAILGNSIYSIIHEAEHSIPRRRTA